VTTLVGKGSSPCGFNGSPRRRSGLTREGGGGPAFYRRPALAKMVHGQPGGTSQYGSGYDSVGSGWAARVGAGLANGEQRPAGQCMHVRRVEQGDGVGMAVWHGRSHGARTSGR
jgi:hypothetical protein